jgi:hypothetical protein
MAARIFISYRTADGRDKATALARDLGARFGEAQVFLDKDDLAAGKPWRDEIQRTLDDSGGVLLLLVTPQLLSATDGHGALRIADPDDPVRREVAAALAAGDRIIPLLCDGVDEMPAGPLPPPFDRLGEYTWRKLRAYDWRGDFERLVEDLEALGLVPIDRSSPGATKVPATGATAPAAGTTVSPGGERRRSLALGAGLAAAALVGAAASFFALRQARGPAAPPKPADVGATRPEGLPGTWLARVADDPPFALVFEREEDRLKFTSVPVPIDGRPAWDEYRTYWLKLTGTELKSVVYRGAGRVITDPGVPLVIDIAWALFNAGGDTKIDGGNLHASASADGTRLEGRLWSNGDQADRPIVLTRAPR